MKVSKLETEKPQPLKLYFLIFSLHQKNDQFDVSYVNVITCNCFLM